MWITEHVKTEGNERADVESKKAATDITPRQSLPFNLRLKLLSPNLHILTNSAGKDNSLRNYGTQLDDTPLEESPSFPFKLWLSTITSTVL